MESMHDRCIEREFEYRDTIKEIKAKIELHSTKPLSIINEISEEDLIIAGLDPEKQDIQEMV
jgi:hypothetical protein